MPIQRFLEVNQHPMMNQLFLGLSITLLVGTLTPVIEAMTASTSSTSTSSTSTSTSTTSTSTTSTSSTSSTTTGTTTTGTTTTTAEATTTLSLEIVFTTYAIEITLSGITAAEFTTATDDFKSAVATSVNGYCKESQTTARKCCNDMKNYSPTNEMYTMASKVMIATNYPMMVTGTSNIVVKFVLEYYTGNALCASGTMARRKRSVTGGYVSAETVKYIMMYPQTTFVSEFNTAASSTLGRSVTVSVEAVTVTGSGNVGTKLVSSWAATVATLSLSVFILQQRDFQQLF